MFLLHSAQMNCTLSMMLHTFSTNCTCSKVFHTSSTNYTCSMIIHTYAANCAFSMAFGTSLANCTFLSNNQFSQICYGFFDLHKRILEWLIDRWRNTPAQHSPLAKSRIRYGGRPWGTGRGRMQGFGCIAESLNPPKRCGS